MECDKPEKSECWHILHLKESVPAESLVVEVDQNEISEDSVDIEDITVEPEDIIEVSTQSNLQASMYQQIQCIVRQAQVSIKQHMRTRSGRVVNSVSKHMLEQSEDVKDKWVYKLPDQLQWVVPYGRGNPNTYCWVWYSKKFQ
jgi:hypothetical protein